MLILLHVVANLVWIGSILSVALALSSDKADARTRGEIALGLYRRIAVPAFLVSFASGLVRLLLTLEYYFSATRFMHGKLTFAVAVIVLHHLIGARAKQMASGARSEPGTSAMAVALLEEDVP